MIIIDLISARTVNSEFRLFLPYPRTTMTILFPVLFFYFYKYKRFVRLGLGTSYVHRGATWAPRLTLIYYKGDNISNYVVLLS